MKKSVKKIKKQLSTFFINQIINQYIYANVFNFIPLQKGVKIVCSLLLRLTTSLPGRLVLNKYFTIRICSELFIEDEFRINCTVVAVVERSQVFRFSLSHRLGSNGNRTANGLHNGNEEVVPVAVLGLDVGQHISGLNFELELVSVVVNHIDV